MASRAPFILVILAVLAMAVYSAIFVVNEREQAIVLRFGEIIRVEDEPGLYLPGAPFLLAAALIVGAAVIFTIAARRLAREPLPPAQADEPAEADIAEAFD